MSDVQKLDPDNPRPQYAQVVDAIRHDVTNGVLEPGQRLPSHSEIAAGYGVSVGTVKRALGVLQGEGVIVSRQGQPGRVRTRQPATGAGVADGPTDAGEEVPDDIRAALAALDRRLVAMDQRLATVEKQLPRASQ